MTGQQWSTVKHEGKIILDYIVIEIDFICREIIRARAMMEKTKGKEKAHWIDRRRKWNKKLNEKFPYPKFDIRMMISVAEICQNPDAILEQIKREEEGNEEK